MLKPSHISGVNRSSLSSALLTGFHLASDWSALLLARSHLHGLSPWCGCSARRRRGLHFSPRADGLLDLKFRLPTEAGSKKAGRQESKKAGRQEGRKAGRQEGRKAGRQEGRKAGRQEGKQFLQAVTEHIRRIASEVSSGLRC